MPRDPLLWCAWALALATMVIAGEWVHDAVRQPMSARLMLEGPTQLRTPSPQHAGPARRVPEALADTRAHLCEVDRRCLGGDRPAPPGEQSRLRREG